MALDRQVARGDGGVTAGRIASLVSLAGGIIVIGVAARLIDQSPTFQTCMHERKHDAAYRTMYEGGWIASRWTRLFLQADCAGAAIRGAGR